MEHMYTFCGVCFGCLEAHSLLDSLMEAWHSDKWGIAIFVMADGDDVCSWE